MLSAPMRLLNGHGTVLFSIVRAEQYREHYICPGGPNLHQFIVHVNGIIVKLRLFPFVGDFGQVAHTCGMILVELGQIHLFQYANVTVTQDVDGVLTSLLFPQLAVFCFGRISIPNSAAHGASTIFLRGRECATSWRKSAISNLQSARVAFLFSFGLVLF